LGREGRRGKLIKERRKSFIETDQAISLLKGNIDE